ncbi:MAG: hypothetical protein ABIG42_01185, partial [bacterium]
MNSLKKLPNLLLVIAFVFIAIACSNGNGPVAPPASDESAIADNIPVSIGEKTGNRTVLAVYDAVIDPVAKTFTIAPAERSIQYHFPLTQFYPNVIQITGYNWAPDFWADIKLVHPFPGTLITGFDTRIIAQLPANPGVSFNYPTLDVTANNAVLLEP